MARKFNATVEDLPVLRTRFAADLAAIENIEQSVADAARAADAQAADARSVLGTVTEMATLARHIAGAISENAAGAQEINAAAQKMNQLTHQMSEAVAEQRRGGEMVVKAVEAIAVVSRQNLVAVEQMTGAAKSLAGESDALRQRVAVFQV
jgi:methyl-accepting chemotaxis protein